MGEGSWKMREYGVDRVKHQKIERLVVAVPNLILRHLTVSCRSKFYPPPPPKGKNASLLMIFLKLIFGLNS
jgi:hypothetical protein